MYYCPESDEDDESMSTNKEEAQNTTMATCIVCHEDAQTDEMHDCKDHDHDGDICSRHLMCSDCFLGYANEELSGGAFEGIRYLGGDSSSTLISSPGNLPCPMFLTGDCETASIPLTTLFRVFQKSGEAAKLYYLASRRVMCQEVEQDRRLEAALASDGENPTTGGNANETNIDAKIEVIRLRVQAALDTGAVVKCPQCRQPGIKNSRCIHIRCHLCATPWCYCCGRTRELSANNHIRCRGCDAVSSLLERQPPDWNSFGIGSEKAAYGALHEFHRRRQAYFVQDVKMSTVPYLWQAFRTANPMILRNVPTPRRHIEWDELDSPVVPPVFGTSQERHLLWGLRPLVNSTTDGSAEDGDNNDHELISIVPHTVVPPTVLVPWSQVFCSRSGMRWILLVVAMVAMIATSVSGVLGSIFLFGFPVMGAIALGLAAGVFYTTTIFLLFRMADYFELNQDNFWARNFPEVQLVGRRQNADGEGPYYSASGRWRYQRRKHISSLLFCISFGSFWVFVSSISVGKRGFGAFGLFFLVPSLNIVILQTLILNYSPLPPFQQVGGQATQLSLTDLSLRLKNLQIYFIGIGISLLYNHASDAVGLFLVMFGVCETIAELLPRFFSENFLMPRPHRMVRSCTFWSGTVVLLYCLWFYFVYSERTAIYAPSIGVAITAFFWAVVPFCLVAAVPENNGANLQEGDQAEADDGVANLEEGAIQAEAEDGGGGDVAVETELTEVVVGVAD